MGSDGALIHGGKSQRRRAGIKAVRAEKRSTKDVKDPGLDRIAAEAKRMEMNEVDPDHYGSGNVIDVKCDGIWCWLWR